ncbi:hypothetical protein ACVWXQ_004232 [Bradyrhizobium sp. S3.14.4]
MAVAPRQEHENGDSNRQPDRYDRGDNLPDVALAESERQQDARDRHDDRQHQQEAAGGGHQRGGGGQHQ